MLKVYSGSKFKKWFIEERHIRAIMRLNGSFHIMNFTEIENNKYYIVESVRGIGGGEVAIKEVEIID